MSSGAILPAALPAACLETLEKSNLAAFGTGLFVGLVVIGAIVVLAAIGRGLAGQASGGGNG